MDQAYKLRLLAEEVYKTAKTIVITSGKGGVGKTNLAVNLSIEMARRKKKVILIDGDFGLANADIILNINPRYNLYHMLAGYVGIDKCITYGPERLMFIPGACGLEKMADLGESERNRILKTLEQLENESDYIIIDTSAGISRNVIQFATSADFVLVVTTPEPTAMMDAYALIKVVSKANEFLRIGIIVNMVSGHKEAQKIAAGVCSVCQSFLNVYVEKTGYIVKDPCVSESVKKRRPFILEYPTSNASYCVHHIADKIFENENKKDDNNGKHGFFGRLFSFMSRK